MNGLLQLQDVLRVHMSDQRLEGLCPRSSVDYIISGDVIGRS